MIGQVTIGKSFGGVVRYVMEKEGAQVLDQAGIRSRDPVKAIQDFNIIRMQRSTVKNAVWHTSISFAYDDVVDDILMKKVGKEYLEKIGLKDNQYLMVRHNDTKHKHIHIISNRIGYNGSVVSDKWCKNRTASICDSLEEKFGLTVARHQKNKYRITDKVPLKKQVKMDLHRIISTELGNGVSSFEIFKDHLKKKEVEVHFQVQKSGRINGIAFKHKSLQLKGSSIDKAFSYGRLAKALQKNNRQTEDQDNDKRRKN